MSGARDAVVAVRLDMACVEVLDMLVGSGIARSRSEAAARLVQIGIGASSGFLRSAQEAAIRARSLREAFASEEFGGVAGTSADATVKVRATEDVPETQTVTETLTPARKEAEAVRETASASPAEDAETGTAARASGEPPSEHRERSAHGDDWKAEVGELPPPFRRAAETAERIDPGGELDAFQAAATGAKRRLEEILRHDPTLVNRHDENGWTPLHLAAFFNHHLCVIALLRLGADPSARSSNGLEATPLHAAAWGCSHSSADMLLLFNRADPNARQADGWTPLHVAAYQKDAVMVRLLLERRADPSLKTNRGETALDLAMRRGRPDVAREISEAHSRSWSW